MILFSIYLLNANNTILHFIMITNLVNNYLYLIRQIIYELILEYY